MGIRFRCHYCETELHVKDFQAGKRGRCPECKGKFRIPANDAPHSLDPDEKQDSDIDAVKSIATEPQATKTQQPVQPVDQRPLKTPQQAPQLPVESSSTSGVAQGNQEPTLPRALKSATDNKWFVRPPSGGQYGPAQSATMWQWLGENRVGRDALVWCEGWPEWLIAESVFDDYFATLSPASAPGELSATSLPTQMSSPVSSNLAAVPTSPNQNSSISERHRLERKQKRRRNYTRMIAVLTVIMLLLMATLAIVLLKQTS